MMKKKWHILLVLCLCMTCLCTACSRETGTAGQSDSQKTAEAETENKKETEIPKEAPEGYVYDYQVSMEPIPKEIADLGGPCVGTVHAFPTRIEMALTQQEVEKDPELKAEVEKCTQEVKDALAEEVGGEFDVQVMSMDENKFEWIFFCREISTGYEFTMGYSNYKYNDPGTGLDNHIYTEEYYDKLDGEKYEKDIKKIIKSIFEDEVSNVYGQRGNGETFAPMSRFSTN